MVFNCENKPKKIKSDVKEESPMIKEAVETKSNDTILTTEKKGILSDRESIACNQDHELEYVLKKFQKRLTIKNVEKIRTYCKEFKTKHKTSDRKVFYEYLKQNNRLRKLENIKK